jgi:hypothetical protein
MLRRIFVIKREEITEGLRKLHNEELHSLYPATDIRVIKSMKMLWMQHVASMREMRNAYRIITNKLKGRKPATGKT